MSPLKRGYSWDRTRIDGTEDLARRSRLASAWRTLDHELNRYIDDRLAA